jgi:hypothetical protein
LDATSELQIGAAKIDVPAHTEGWYIVDGQQRVTALAAALLDLDHGGDPRWEIWFAPEANQFHAGVPSAEQVGKHVPLKALGDLRRLGRWLQQCDLPEEQQTRVEEVQQRLLDYEIPGYVVDTDNVDALRGVFARMNSTGVRMRAEEVFQALLGQGSNGAQGKKGINLVELQKAADLDGFGEPPRAEVLKALLANIQWWIYNYTITSIYRRNITIIVKSTTGNTQNLKINRCSKIMHKLIHHFRFSRANKVTLEF